MGFSIPVRTKFGASRSPDDSRAVMCQDGQRRSDFRERIEPNVAFSSERDP
jgi:hypothetical protein